MSKVTSINDPIIKAPLVGPTTALKFEKIGIRTIRDLLFYVPFRYKDTSSTLTVEQLIQEGQGITNVEVISIFQKQFGRYLVTKATVGDETGQFDIVWFNQQFVIRTINKGKRYLFEGKIKKGKTGKWEMNSPQSEKAEDFDAGKKVHLGRLTPFYEGTLGMSSKWIRSRINMLKDQIKILITASVNPKFEVKIIEDGYISLADAIYKLHFPEGFEDIDMARKRLGLDEMIRLGFDIENARSARLEGKAPVIKISLNDQANFKKHLEYELTVDQLKSIDEIADDMSKNVPMKRLLNGDVGSGKTIVAAYAAYATIKAGYSVVIMAPTTILAQQHYRSFEKLLKDFEIKIQLLVSGQSLEPTIKNQIIIGTHAILYEEFLPENVGLIVVDEQHRFGVAQREKLRTMKSTPHYLTMTATPIPRTLTHVLYGDTDISIIKTMPKSRIEIKSFFVPVSKRESCFEWTRTKILESKLKEQAFVIFPLVEESDKVEAKAAVTEYENLSKGVFKDLKVGLIHGKMKDKDKDQILLDFKAKKYNVLVATSVVEVGIDIADATIMIIENADRFGLAQLHQFRGRVGRGDMQSYCYVIASDQVKKGSAPFIRLEYFCSHASGFDVAEYDLSTRGPGEVYGSTQSGIPNLKIANIADLETLGKARAFAKWAVESLTVEEKNEVLNGLFGGG